LLLGHNKRREGKDWLRTSSPNSPLSPGHINARGVKPRNNTPPFVYIYIYFISFFLLCPSERRGPSLSSSPFAEILKYSAVYMEGLLNKRWLPIIEHWKRTSVRKTSYSRLDLYFYHKCETLFALKKIQFRNKLLYESFSI
jgi:hypothetical protein